MAMYNYVLKEFPSIMACLNMGAKVKRSVNDLIQRSLQP